MKRAVALFAFLTFVVAAPSASGAEFGIVPGSFKVRMLDAEGNPENRAGSHPDRLQIDFGLNVEDTGTSARDLIFELPPGFSGSPNAVPACSREIFEKGEEECPDESQVGALALELSGGAELTLPIFQVEPAPGEEFAFGSVPAFNVPLTMELRPSDFGITFKTSDLPEAAVSEGHVELWGVPADRQVGTSIPRLPFLTTPTRCGPLLFSFRTRSRQADAPWLSAEAETDAPLGGCQNLPFEPKLGLQLGNPLADSPTGVQIDLNLPESNGPDELASAGIKGAAVELPEGVTVSPGGASGLTACTDAQLGVGEATEASCPASARVGAVEVVSPELREPLLGDIYLGAERPEERFRLFMVVHGPGVVVKFVGALRADPATGRLSAVLGNLPQVPVSRLTMSIDGGPRALLASPLTCGSFASTGSFEPSSGNAAVKSSALVTIGASADGSQCQSVAPFSPLLIATSVGHGAGRSTAFSMTVLRRSGEQLTRRFSVSLPKGLSAALGQVKPCPDSAAASAACPAASRLGGAIAQAGSGSSSVALNGDVYLAGAYRQAPFSLVMGFRAAIGPFDLGTLAVRIALQIDRQTGQITVVSDPLPSLVEGIPVRFQSIGMALDRPGLIRNPTSCAPADFDALFESNGGVTATSASALTVRGCRKLGFKPHFSLTLSGRSELHKHGRPSVGIFARFRQGDTSLRSMRVSLPRALKFNIAGLRELCPRQDALEGLCAEGARAGTAVARGSLLSEPLRGAIYVVRPKGDGLPDLSFSVAAKGLHLTLSGTTSQQHGHLVTNLVGLPDVPLSTFEMHLRGGKRGVMSLSSGPCGNERASGLMSGVLAKGQDGARRSLQLSARVHCVKTASSR